MQECFIKPLFMRQILRFIPTKALVKPIPHTCKQFHDNNHQKTSIIHDCLWSSLVYLISHRIISHTLASRQPTRLHQCAEHCRNRTSKCSCNLSSRIRYIRHWGCLICVLSTVRAGFAKTVRGIPAYWTFWLPEQAAMTTDGR